MFFRLVKQMAEREGVTEQLKAGNQMEWIGRMNNIRSRATEIVNTILFTANRSTAAGRLNLSAVFFVAKIVTFLKILYFYELLWYNI